MRLLMNILGNPKLFCTGFQKYNSISLIHLTLFTVDLLLSCDLVHILFPAPPFQALPTMLEIEISIFLHRILRSHL